MRSVSLRLVDLERNPMIPLGFEGENEYTTVRVDCKKIFDEHPDAVPTLAVTPPEGDSYPAVVVRDGDIVSWTVTDSDLVHSGTGEIQFAFVIDETIIGKTYKARTKVLDSIVPSGEAPTPIQNWLIQAAAALQALPTEVASSVAALMGAMVGVGETLDPDDDVTVNYDPDNNTLTIGVPHGRDGEDGHTPAISANKVGKVATFYVDGVAIATISDGTDGDPTALIDDTSTALNRTWSAKKISDENLSLKTEINSRPEVKESTETGIDLDVSDEDGNVILRLENGHIKTKKFDSENANGVKDSTATGVDLDISDDDGYVVMRLQGGHIKAKNFDSSKVGDPANLNTTEKSSIVGAINEIVANTVNSRPAVETFTKSGSYTNGTALELTIDETFNKGDRLLIHVEDGSAFYEAGHRATYYENGTAFLSSHKGSNAYIEHIVTANNATIKVRFGGSEYGHDVSNITVYVYRINGEIKPKIVTVASDGSGMFTTIRGAIDSITDANAHTNPYEIWVYPGTYNTLSGYSDEEIADVQVPYTETSFVGPKLTDGISIKGVGKTRDEVVLTASLDPEVWSTDVRGQVSPLNIQGSGSIENMTILGYNTRYCVHDDFRNPSNEVTFRKLKNLKFGGYLTNTSKFTTYGAGMSTPRDYIIEDCDFGFGVGIHGNTNFSKECQIILRNCSGYVFGIGDYADEETDATVNFEFDNCSFERIFVANKYPSISPHVRIYGVGNEQTMVSCDADYIYEFGNIVKIEAGFNAGEVVRHEATTDMFELTDSIDTYCGIIINADSNYSYMQKSGFISSAFLGLSNLSVGDYVTVDSVTKKVVSGGTASNAIGVVVATESNGTAFIKMRK